MAEPFIGQIKAWGGNFAPRGYVFCDGQLLLINQNTAYFSIAGTLYGGDGRTTTGVPNLQGRAPAGAGRGPGLTPRTPGQHFGAETVTLTLNQIASHPHALNGTDERADNDNPTNNAPADLAGDTIYSTAAPDTVLPQSVLPTSVGSGGAHDNMQPYMPVSYIIALVGSYPSRS